MHSSISTAGTTQDPSRRGEELTEGLGAVEQSRRVGGGDGDGCRIHDDPMGLRRERRARGGRRWSRPRRVRGGVRCATRRPRRRLLMPRHPRHEHVGGQREGRGRGTRGDRGGRRGRRREWHSASILDSVGDQVRVLHKGWGRGYQPRDPRARTRGRSRGGMLIVSQLALRWPTTGSDRHGIRPHAWADARSLLKAVVWSPMTDSFFNRPRRRSRPRDRRSPG